MSFVPFFGFSVSFVCPIAEKVVSGAAGLWWRGCSGQNKFKLLRADEAALVQRNHTNTQRAHFTG